MKHEELTSTIIGICILIHEKLGPGLLESIYEEVICYELDKRKIIYKRQQGIPVLYDHIKMDLGFRADIIIENKVLLEIKSTQMLAPVDAKRVITYLRFAEIEVGLLINFNVGLLKEGITRLVLDVK
jgi:GxxExxY protein